MKRLVFYSILILVFLSACKFLDPDDVNGMQTGDLTDQNIARVTVYLDDNEPAGSRAMNKEFAMMGCDYFEVFFLSGNGGDLVKGQWRIGERARVKDVPRGIDYGGVSSAPASGGSAILLAGKSDKTIMGIGRLSMVDEDAGTIISSTAKSVTFDVAALKTGVSDDLDLTSFLTSAGSTGGAESVNKTNTTIVSDDSLGKEFFMYKLAGQETAISAIYTFRLHSGTAGDYTGFGDYTGGLRVATGGGTVDKKYPSYTLRDGGTIDTIRPSTPIVILSDENTEVTMVNNREGEPFNPAVSFRFNTTGTPGGSIFSLVFEIPVYALGDDSSLWYIRPGYGVFHYELDDGLGGMGGAVLIQTGEVSAPVVGEDFIIKILHAPDKWRYRWKIGSATGAGTRTTSPPNEVANPVLGTGGANPVSEYDREFRHAGIIVQVLNANSKEPMEISGLTHNYGAYIAIAYEDKLQFYIGGSRVPSSGYILPEEYYGLVEVTVKLTNPSKGITREDKFYILASSNYTQDRGGNDGDTSVLDFADPKTLASNIVNVTTSNDFLNLMNPQTLTIFRLMANVNIPQCAISLPNPVRDAVLTIIVAGRQDLTLGRNGSTDQWKFQNDGSGLAAFYFGLWPFDNLDRSPASLNTSAGNRTYPFSVNPVGPYNSTSQIYFNKMLITEIDAGIHKVDLDEKLYSTSNPLVSVKGVDVHHKDYLY